MQGIRVIDNVPEVECETDVAAHAANDVVCQPVELVGVALPNGCVVVQSIVVTDYDSQGATLEAVFMSEPLTVGNNNATMAIPDSQAHKILGYATISTYLALDQNSIGVARNVGLEMRPDPSTPESIWMALRTTGTPTYASGRLTVKVGVLRG